MASSLNLVSAAAIHTQIEDASRHLKMAASSSQAHEARAWQNRFGHNDAPIAILFEACMTSFDMPVHVGM